MKKPVFVNNQIYHIYNRGVEKRQIFMDDNDCFRFIHDLFEFNDVTAAGKFSEVRPPIVKNDRRRDLLVEILCFCLMPNHYHLILKQLKDNGIYLFMKKLGTGYTMFFNKKYERVGSLFQGNYKAVLIERDEYFLHLFRYIHLNPIELIYPEWKKQGIEDWAKANNFLDHYRWSSHLDYISKKNFPSVSSRDFLKDFFPNEQGYKKFINQYLISDFNEIGDITFE